MRVAIFVLGLSLIGAGGVSEASDNIQNPSAHRAAAVLADGVMSAPAVSQFSASDLALSPNSLYVRESGIRNPLPGAMSFVPSPRQATPRFDTFDQSPATRAQERFNPATIPLPATRSLEDHLLTGFIALMLIAYQLRRKHRFLRPHQFSA